MQIIDALTKLILVLVMTTIGAFALLWGCLIGSIECIILGGALLGVNCLLMFKD